MSRYRQWTALAVATAGLAMSAHAQPGPGGGAGAGQGRGPGGGMRMMQMVDGNGDGKISLAEYTAFQQMRWQRFSGGADKVTVATLMPMQRSALNGITPAADGTVSKADYEAATPGKFKAADTNGDGSLDQAELMASVRSGG